MKLRIKNESIFDHSADAIILTIDGESKGMGGGIARKFEERYPEVWRFIESQVEYPVELGTSVSVKLPTSIPYQYVFLASTLVHLHIMNKAIHGSPVKQAFGMAVENAQNYRLKTIRCGLPTGGWRSDPLNAFMIVSEVEEMKRSSTKGLELIICIPDKEIFESVMKFAINIGFDI